MRLFFAGSFSGVKEDVLKEWGMENKLYSYVNEPKNAVRWGSKGLLLDSGAFSAWSKGVKIDPNALCDFIEEHKPEFAIQLDTIGDAEASWHNFVDMDKRVDVLPVIHSGATDFQIRRVLNSKEYICLGAISTMQSNKDSLKKWIDHIFAFPEIRNKKIHALGIMSEDILLRYPFYSADSSSALSAVRYPVNPDDKYLFWKQKTQHYTRLYEDSIKRQLELQKHVTEVWKKRGIEWDD